MNNRGPFEQDPGEPRDRSAQMVFIGMGLIGLVLFILFASPLSIFGGDDEDVLPGEAPSQLVGGDGPAVPEGFDALSQLFDDLEQPQGTEGPYALTVNLIEPVTDGRNLALYTYTDGSWQRVSSATLVNNGAAASGEVTEMPGNVAVLRLTDGAVQVTGWLQAGGELAPEALPALSTINPVDFAPAPDGSLIGTASEIPEQADGIIVPTVRAALPEDDEAVNEILASPALREEHISALVQLALEPGNAGVDVDYRRVSPARTADFTAFIRVLADELHQANRTLSVTLPTPVRSGLSWDTGAYDWEELAPSADLLKLWPEVDPSMYYENMTAVLDFLSEQVDMSKVALVVTRQSYELASDGLRPLTLHDGLSLASQIEVRTTSDITPDSSVVIVGRNIFQEDGGTGLQWDEVARAVSFQYPGDGGQRTVWLENGLSLAFRLDLARSYQMGGVAVMDVSNNPGLPAYWEVVRTYGESGEVTPVLPNSLMLQPSWEVQAGSTEEEDEGSLVWTAPSQPGAYDVSLIVSDGVIRASQRIVLEVQAAAP